MYICISYMYVYVCVYVYIYIERERDIDICLYGALRRSGVSRNHMAKLAGREASADVVVDSPPSSGDPRTSTASRGSHPPIVVAINSSSYYY